MANDEQLELELGLPPAEPTPTDEESLDALRKEFDLLAHTAGEDLRQIVIALGLGDHPRDYSPHEMVYLEVLPAIFRVKMKADAFDAMAQAEAGKHSYDSKPAGLYGIPEMDLGNGRKAQLVGRKLPPDEARRLGLRR